MPSASGRNTSTGTAGRNLPGARWVIPLSNELVCWFGPIDGGFGLVGFSFFFVQAWDRTGITHYISLCFLLPMLCVAT